MVKILDEVARSMGFDDYDDMVVKIAMPLLLTELEIMLKGEGS
jgi:hypothetical protein